MNNSHYPDLERCKKLTEIGFPVTELCYDRHAIEKIEQGFGITSDGEYMCPSVMEMLDVIPRYLGEGIDSQILNIFPAYGDSIGWFVYYIGGKFDSAREISLPNALADLIIWLHENGYITFNS